MLNVSIQSSKKMSCFFKMDPLSHLKNSILNIAYLDSILYNTHLLKLSICFRIMQNSCPIVFSERTVNAFPCRLPYACSHDEIPAVCGKEHSRSQTD